MKKIEEINLKSAEDLFKRGEFAKSLSALSKLEEKTDVSLKNLCLLHILKSKIYDIMGENSKEEDSLNIAFQKAHDIGDSSLLAEIFILKAEKSISKGEKEKFFEFIENAERILQDKNQSLPLKMGDIYCTKGHYHSFLEVNFDQALNFYKKSLKIYKKQNEKRKTGEILIEIAGLLFYKGDLDQSKKNYMESLKINEEIGNKYGIVACYNGIGILLSFTEDLKNSLFYLKKCLAIAEEINLKYYIATALVNIGEMVYENGDLMEAGDYYRRSLKIYEKSHNITGVGYVLLDLVILNIELDNKKGIQENFSQLEKLYLEYHKNFKEIDEYYRMAQGFILKNRPRMRDKVKAEEIFKSFVKNENTDFQLTNMALLNLCELLLNELSMTNDYEILEEIQPIIDKLLHLEKQQYDYNLIAKGYLLQAKLALIQFKLEEAQHFLTLGQQIAQEKGLQLLAMKISAEHDELLNHLDLWEGLNKKQNQISMAERIKYAKLNEQMDLMIRKHSPKKQKLQQEKPIFLSIITNGGIPLFKLPFIESWKEQNVFSGLISAFNVFSKALFSNTVDRVKMGEFIILLKQINSFIVCYVIKGSSYLAQQKLTNFSKKVRTTPEIWYTLNEYSKTGEVLTVKENPYLKFLIKKIFMMNEK